MDGLMMAFPLTLPHLFQRAADYYPEVEIVSRRPDKSLHRTNYAEFHARAQQLANALKRLGLKPGERVATLAWNHSRHLEAYFGIPLAEWLRGPLRDWGESLLSEQRLREGGFFDANLVRRTWAEHLSGAHNHQYLLWNVLMFEAWRVRWA